MPTVTHTTDSFTGSLDKRITDKAATIEKTPTRYSTNQIDTFVNNCVEWFEPNKIEKSRLENELKGTLKISDILNKMIAGGYGGDKQMVNAGNFAGEDVYLKSNDMDSFFNDISAETRKGGVRGHGV